MKYEAPFIEIVRFQKDNILLKASSDIPEGGMDDGGAVVIPPSDDNPFPTRPGRG